MTVPAGVPLFQRFFRSVGRVKIDRNDVKRFRAFIDDLVDDLAIAGRNAATWNGRDVIAPQDLPVPTGLQERMREFDGLEEAGEIRGLLAPTIRRPPGDVTFSEETEDVLVELFGGLAVALARTFREVDPEVVHPGTEHWDRVTTIFRLVF
ncbi:DUF1931 family protein [Actinomycetospora chiangmaiensis]|uniref:DUF1931 family protein n=1 Tax=Actinomycetospora chiangmaiensis TaxID=402650 RepID=UPI00036726E2|nr:DUF1931 family protein [Actinomycetospora chiangmaiensis]